MISPIIKFVFSFLVVFTLFKLPRFVVSEQADMPVSLRSFALCNTNFLKIDSFKDASLKDYLTCSISVSSVSNKNVLVIDKCRSIGGGEEEEVQINAYWMLPLLNTDTLESFSKWLLVAFYLLKAVFVFIVLSFEIIPRFFMLICIGVILGLKLEAFLIANRNAGRNVLIVARRIACIPHVVASGVWNPSTTTIAASESVAIEESLLVLLDDCASPQWCHLAVPQCATAA